MAFLGLRRDDLTIHAINGEDQLGLRWHRLLFPAVGMPAAHLAPLDAAHLAPLGAAHLAQAAAVHLGPASVSQATPAPSERSRATLDRPVDAPSAAPWDQDSVGLSPAEDPAAPQDEDVSGPLDDAASPAGDANPPDAAPDPQTETTADAPPAPGDATPPGGFIPKSEAVLWSGPALVVFPADSDETSGDAAAQDLADPGNAAAPDVAGAPDAVTRADLDPVLASMASGASSGAKGDLSAAFLPPGSGDLDHLPCGLEPGFAVTPLPPPPEII